MYVNGKILKRMEKITFRGKENCRKNVFGTTQNGLPQTAVLGRSITEQNNSVFSITMLIWP